MCIFNFWQQCSLGLYSSGMWQHVVPDGSRQDNVPKKAETNHQVNWYYMPEEQQYVVTPCCLLTDTNILKDYNDFILCVKQSKKSAKLPDPVDKGSMLISNIGNC